MSVQTDLQLAAGPGHLDEALLRAWHEARTATQEHDVPGLPRDTWPDVLADARVGDATQREEVWALRKDGAVVGGCRLSLPLAENTDLGEVDLYVVPSARGEGLGRALLDHAADRLRAAGRARLVLWGHLEPVDTDGPGSTFARAVGARRVSEDVLRTLDLTPQNRARWAALRAEAEAAASAYEVVTWEGPAPDHLVEGVLALKEQISTDAPTDDLAWAGESWDVERLRVLEAEAAAKGRRRLVAAARHRGDGHLAALTDLLVPAAGPEEAHQWDTVVLRADRGHRLGLLVKLANLGQLLRRCPRTRRVSTWNSASNAPMVAVNDRLGFAAAARSPVWELGLG
ncbi:MAG: GNAT family N-acetyltransferase [Actinomycetota bacterium]|nr:GNAT family N-acetyltransferase [Actinomycetota bacterium]